MFDAIWTICSNLFMIGHDRQSHILDFLQKHPSSSILQLQESLGVSRSTIRRDLVELEEQGEIVRVHGGVVHRDMLRGEPTYDKRGREAIAAKRLIAQTVSALVPENSVVFLDAGTTCVEVARHLAPRRDLRIFTHSIRLLMEIGDAAASLTCIGGEFRAVSQALVGGLSLSWLSHLHCDLAILGASGLSAQGLSTTELSEATMKQQILARSSRTIVVADQRKWARSAAVTFAPWSEIQALVTNEPPPAELQAVLTSQQVEIHLPAGDSTD